METTNNNIIILQISKEELETLINKAVSAAISSLITPPPFKTPLDDEYLDVEQTAKMLHKKVATIYHYTRNRIIPSYKRGNRLLFKKAELQNWVDACKIKTNEEIEQIAKTYYSKRY